MQRFIWMLLVLIPALAIIGWVVRARISKFQAQADRRRQLDDQKVLLRGEEQLIDSETELHELQEHLAQKKRRRFGRDDAQ